MIGDRWLDGYSVRAKFSDGHEAEMAYERLDEALRQLKTDRERAEATENQQKKAGAEAIIRFARIKSAVIGPIFGEVVARLAAEGFFGETVDKQNDGSGPISLNVNLSEDDGLSRQGTSKYGLIRMNIPVNLESLRRLTTHQQSKLYLMVNIINLRK